MNKNQTYQLICKNVKHLREKNELSLEEMAQIIDTPITSLKKLENGIITRRVRIDIVYRIESHFGITPKELFTTTLK